MAIIIFFFLILIQNLMLNSNLKSDIQKNIEVKRLKTRKGQTEFDRVPTLM
jgi:hypothetical protein